MEKIHDKPKTGLPHMTVILNDSLGKQYISIDADDKAGQDQVFELCQPQNISLQAYTVIRYEGNPVWVIRKKLWRK
jgi:hypothetical protein